ncbi:MAG: hypothetical protein ACYTG1_11470 [Planctomycetota bacterium]|jgi:uncharacterized membrane protein
MSALPIQFDQPYWLLLLLLIAPCFFIARRSIGGQSRAKATVTFAFRVIVILLLTAALAHPIWEKRGKGLTVSILLDRSQSIPLPLKRSSERFLGDAADAKERDEDRVAVITVAREANIQAMPDTYSDVRVGDEGDLTATNLAAGVRMVLAVMPDDTANRIVLASDGNETVESVLAAAELARANGVPIDVFPIEYEHRTEVLFDRIVAPARARQGQTARLKLVLQSRGEASGRVYLRLNGDPLDLNGEAEGDALAVQLEPGVNLVPVTIALDSPGPQQFDALFEPDDPAADSIERNNRAVAVTFVTGEGKVLIVDDGGVESAYLARALLESDIEVDIRGPDTVGGLLFLSGYDAVILANIPRWAFDDEQVRDMHAYVHDLGGGFAMLGGQWSFGAGGWIDSDVAKLLPVKLDPPSSRQTPRGALALIMHSCEMPQGNYWGQKVAESAIEALSRLDYVGIVEYNWGGGGGNSGSSWALPMSLAGDKSRALAATKQMVVGDMPDFGASMTLALQGLTSVKAGQKHAIIISDGDPSPPSDKLLADYIAAKVTVTTIMVGGHGTGMDRAKMQKVATKTGGRFYNVINPKQLPKIFIKEAQIVSRSLIQEGDLYQPLITHRLPGGPLDGFESVPPLDGYVLTAPRDGLAQLPMVVPTSEGNDPIFAYWNYGLGKAIAFTSDLTGRWGGRWAAWGRFRSFWEQAVRWSMRPSSPANMLVNTRLEGDLAVVEVEALDADASYLNFLRTRAVVLRPDGNADPLDLQQVGPGRYRGEFRVDDAGAYLVNINYATAADETQQGNLQAAVNVPYAREFRAITHNTALLRELAETTGGRVLAPDDPVLADLFNRDDLEIPKSPRRIWDLLTIIAAALFVLDVASRRVSVDPKWLAGLAARAVGRRPDATTDTMSAWKRTRAEVAHRRRTDVERAAAKTRAVKFEADEASREHAIDVGAEEVADRRPSAPPAAAPPPAPAASDEDEGSHTSRLLAAKRRARGEGEEGGADG